MIGKNTMLFALKNSISFLALILCMCMPSLARADLMTYTYDFTASGFTSYYGSTVPFDPVTGSITVSFDTAMSYPGQPSDIWLNSLNIPLASALSFSYSPSDERMIIGGLQSGTGGVASGTDDFWLIFYGGENPSFSSVVYSISGYSDFFKTNSGTVTASTVPIPAAIWLFGSGILGLVCLRKKIHP